VKAMELKRIIKQIVRRNRWLSGLYDYIDGDPMAINESEEIFINEPVECKNLDELYNMLKTYDGVYKYKNLLFFNSSAYGVFVYDIRKPDSYIEHLNIEYMSFDRFASIIDKLLKRNIY
jgi:hypothetical protein